MFAVLAYFCYFFSVRALSKRYAVGRKRVEIHLGCSGAIVLSMAVIALEHTLDGAISRRVPRLTFYGEAAGLIAFGISWLTASRMLPYITAPGERFSPMRAVNPE